MMDFIFVPAIFGIVSYAIYSVFELFVRRKERLEIIAKLGDKFGPELLTSKLNLSVSRNSYGALKGGCLLIGLGLGLLMGFLILNNYIPVDGNMLKGDLDIQVLRHYNETRGVVYGSSVLIFGGLGLLAAFLIENNMSKKDKK